MAGVRATLLWAVAAFALAARAHTVITYPGWRGDNLQANGTAPEQNPNTIGIDYNENNGTFGFPYGMQWMYPCGGMPLTTNRTYWPVGGGALSVQPGWFPGHSKAFIYVNIGITNKTLNQSAPPNYSLNVVPPFQITGPNNSYYPGQFCLPQVRMPADTNLSVGDDITIQVVEAAQHGASLYSCVDVTLVDPTDDRLTRVTPQNCYNSSDIGFNLVFTTAALSAAPSLAAPSILITLLVAFFFAVAL